MTVLIGYKLILFNGYSVNKISKILSFVRALRNGAKISDVKIDSGGGPNVTAEHFAPAGDDSFPLTTDYAIASNTQGTGKHAVLGYVDPINEPKATPGDKRIYARDAETGAVVVEMWLKNDGSSIMENANGSIELSANGDIIINGVTIAANGGITAPNSLVLNGKELDGHDHPIAWTDPAGSGTSGPNN